MKEVMFTLLLWVSQHTGLSIDTNNLPLVKQLPNDQLATIMFRGDVPAGYNQHRLLGVFQHHENIIYISESIDLNTIYGQSVLVHELVHHLQFANDLDHNSPCRKSLERLAYELQREFLLAHNHRSMFSQQHIQKKSQCG